MGIFLTTILEKENNQTLFQNQTAGEQNSQKHYKICIFDDDVFFRLKYGQFVFLMDVELFYAKHFVFEMQIYDFQYS